MKEEDIFVGDKCRNEPTTIYTAATTTTSCNNIITNNITHNQSSHSNHDSAISSTIDNQYSNHLRPSINSTVPDHRCSGARDDRLLSLTMAKANESSPSSGDHSSTGASQISQGELAATCNGGQGWKLLIMGTICLTSLILTFLGLGLALRFSSGSQSNCVKRVERADLADYVTKDFLINGYGSGSGATTMVKFPSSYPYVQTLNEVGFLVALFGLNLNLASFVVSLIVSYFLVKIITIAHPLQRMNAYLKYKSSTSTSSIYALCSLALSIVFYLIALIIHVLAHFDLQTVIIACIFMGITVIIVMLSILHTTNCWYYSINDRHHTYQSDHNLLSQRKNDPANDKGGEGLPELKRRFKTSSMDLKNYLLTLV